MYSPEQIDNPNKLAGFLRCNPQALPLLMNKISEDGLTYIQQIKIPKRNYWKRSTPYRIVYKTMNGVLDNSLKVLKFELQRLYTPSECVFGFIRGRNIVSNAKKHLNQDYILNLDIKDFFESINLQRVSDCFVSLGFNLDIVKSLARIVTHNDTLVTGFPTSPIIANIICKDMDEALCELCLEHNIVYSRYADDLTFSGSQIEIMEKIITIINSFGFSVNDDKTKLRKRGQSQYVTGLSVSDKQFPRISRKTKRRLRQELYYIRKFGLKEHVSQVEGNDIDWKLRKKAAHIMGWLHFINSVEPAFSQKCMNVIKQIDYEDNSLFMDVNRYIKNK